MKILITILLVCSVTAVGAQNLKRDKKAILKVMKAQEKAWGKHDLEGFMDGYWKHDSLKFYGSRGLTYGWENTLENYKVKYPTPKHTGKLTFVIQDISNIGKKSYWVMGRYFLMRKAGDADGIFMIIFKKIDGDWKIVADMSCG